MSYLNKIALVLASLALVMVTAEGDGSFDAVQDGAQAPTPLSRYRNLAHRQWLQDQYPFLDLESAGLTYYGDKTKFEVLWSRMAHVLYTGEGELNIVHMGGSHVQAGIIGHRMRELFNDLAPGSVSQRGLLVPFRVGRTNSTVFTGSQSNGEWSACRCSIRKENCFWGMSGFTLSTASDSAWLKLWAFRDDSSHYTGDRVRLYHSVHPSQPNINWAGKAPVDHFHTDSVQGFTEWQLGTVTDTLTFAFNRDSSSTAEVQVYASWLGSSAASGIVWNDIGVNGASTYSFLRAQGMESQLSSISPDLVFFGIGVNDAHVPGHRFDPSAFISRYDSLVSVFKSVNPDVALVFLTNSDNYYKGRPNPNGERVRAAMEKLAQKHNAAVWDLFAVMGGQGSIYQWQTHGLAKSDKIHFTREGYILQADLMYLSVLDELANALQFEFATVEGERRITPPAEE